MNLISIQSHVAYGHVGNSAAVFALQRIGVDVWPINTVAFSNHTGYGGWTGAALGARHITDIMEGIEARAVLSNCEGLISGYIGAPPLGEAVLDAVERMRLANPAAKYCCDPVLGDSRQGVYVDESTVDFFRGPALSAADVVTPNQFELGVLTGLDTGTQAGLLAALDLLHGRGLPVLLVTSVQTEETPAGTIDMVASAMDSRCRLRTPLLPIDINGAGDTVTALFFAHWLRQGSVAEALSQAGSSIYGVLKATADRGSNEILLIDAQDELVAPSELFTAEALS